jgi:TRAP-type mannitol/chloroaromatic compound transport system permease small subunit
MNKNQVDQIDSKDPPHVDLDGIMHHTELPHSRVSLFLDGVVTRVCEAFSSVWIILVAIIIINVVVRYVFSHGYVQLEELQWHLYAIGFMMGQSYTFVHDEHIRVDFIHDKLSLRTQVWIELFGLLFLLLPFISVIIYYSIPYVAYSWEVSEVSQSPGGLPARWLIKSFLTISFTFLLMAALSRLSRVITYFTGYPVAVKPDNSSGN